MIQHAPPCSGACFDAGMTHEEFTAIAKEYGFARVYFLAPESFDLGENPHRLAADARAAFPFAASIACLVYPYAPFTADERIPAYYLASNKAYFGMKALTARLGELGVRAEKAEIPLKPALEQAHIGAQLKTTLRAIPGLGTRFVLMCIALGGIPPLEYDESFAPPCENCRACEAACPSGAIGAGGHELSKCMRIRMETACHEDFVRDRQRTFIGCEICQYACPLNAALERSEPDPAAREAFDVRRLIEGDAAAARKLTGKNMTSNGKLTAEAIAFAARDGLIPEDELAALLDKAGSSPFPAVRDAVRWAREKLMKKHE